MTKQYDAIIAGGGPAGSTAAITLRGMGFDVVVLEKDVHPRFHIGESILPRNTPLLRELGIEEAIRALPHVPKYGAEFGFGNDLRTRRFTFRDGLLPGFPVFNIERSVFDKALIDLARKAGAEVREGEPVTRILSLSDDGVEVQTRAGSVRGRVLLDASGHGTIVARHLGIRRNFEEPELKKVAYFQHFEGVWHHEGEERGHPCLAMCDEGWFWIIPLNERKTSVGFVTHPGFAQSVGVAPRHILAWAIARCPLVLERMRSARGSAENEVLSDFSYRCRPYAGPGYFMMGDAACFLDPIFSTGVTLAMVSAHRGAQFVGQALRGEISFAAARQTHIGFIERSSKPFWRLIRSYYTHSFRELFMNGGGAANMPGAIISILAGQVFPSPVAALRWRHRLFDACVWAQQYFSLAPRREKFRLLEQPAQEFKLAVDQVLAS